MHMSSSHSSEVSLSWRNRHLRSVCMVSASDLRNCNEKHQSRCKEQNLNLEYLSWLMANCVLKAAAVRTPPTVIICFGLSWHFTGQRFLHYQRCWVWVVGSEWIGQHVIFCVAISLSDWGPSVRTNRPTASMCTNLSATGSCSQLPFEW